MLMPNLVHNRFTNLSLHEEHTDRHSEEKKSPIYIVFDLWRSPEVTEVKVTLPITSLSEQGISIPNLVSISYQVKGGNADLDFDL